MPSSFTAPSSSPHSPAVAARHLVKRYGDLEVLRDVSLEVPEGSVTSIIGSSGSGKSTLLRCLNLLERPDQGELAIAAEAIRFDRNPQGDIVGLDRRQLQRLRAKVSMVFQQFNLWPHFTVLGNVTEAPMRVQGLSRRRATECAEHYLERVGEAAINAAPSRDRPVHADGSDAGEGLPIHPSRTWRGAWPNCRRKAREKLEALVKPQASPTERISRSVSASS